MITIIAALALNATQAPKDATNIAIESAKACIAEQSIKYAKGSKESADVLADIVVYRCSDGTALRTSILRVFPARMMALDAIVTTRMGGI